MAVPQKEHLPLDYNIAQLGGSYEAFGALIDFLSRIEPFARFDLGNFSRALRSQLVQGDHLAALAGQRIVGYVGWLPTRRDIAEPWMRDLGILTPVNKDAADAVVLTVVAATEKQTIAPLIRRARELNPARRVYFKREKDDGAKKASVQNTTAS